METPYLTSEQCLKLSQKSCRSSCLESQIINIKLKKNQQKVPGPPQTLSALDWPTCGNFQHCIWGVFCECKFWFKDTMKTFYALPDPKRIFDNFLRISHIIILRSFIGPPIFFNGPPGYFFLSHGLMTSKFRRVWVYELPHDHIIKWKLFPRYWPFVRGIHQSPLNSPPKGQWRGALMFSLICTWINDWVNNGEAGDLRRYRTHYVVTVMFIISVLVYYTISILTFLLLKQM